MSRRRWHTPSVFAVALALAGLALFMALGSWQVRRAHEKEALFAAFDATEHGTPVTLAQARQLASATRYPLVEVNGSFDAAHGYVLDDQVHAGRVGVMVYGVFMPSAGGPALLLNRGFLARDARGAVPSIPPPPAGVRKVHALYAPPPGIALRMGGDALPRQSHWPKTMIYLDLAEVAHDLGHALDPRVLLQVGADDPPVGFVREWRPGVFPPERHYAYAFTWFAFGAVVVALFAILHWRRPTSAT